MLRELTDQLQQGSPLSNEQVSCAVMQLTEEQLAPEFKAEFLTALAQKGETTEELAAFARELRNRAIAIPLDPETRQREILDVCGTGGDRLNTFNISTTVALIAAAGGICVAKHGNRAITSQAGSADVLEALGIAVDFTPEQAAASLRDHQFTFLFAPKYHPAFKHIAPARKLCAERGQRTIFNFLGPLLNPARPTVQLVGVPHGRLCETIARVLQSLGTRRAMVVSGRVGDAWLDELSTLGENTIAEFYQDRGFSASINDFNHLPLQRAALADLAGGDAKANAKTIREILRGQERGPKRDAVLLNAAAAFFVAGHAKSLTEGWESAVELIESGRANAKLESLISARRT